MSERREIIETYTTNCATINFRSDGITEVLFIDEYELDVPGIKAVQEAIMKIGVQHPLYIMVVPGPLGGITREARDFPMFDTNNTGAIGVVTKLIHQRILGNLYFKFKRAQFSNYKMFKDSEKIEVWLKSEMIKEN